MVSEFAATEWSNVTTFLGHEWVDVALPTFINMTHVLATEWHDHPFLDAVLVVFLFIGMLRVWRAVAAELDRRERKKRTHFKKKGMSDWREKDFGTAKDLMSKLREATEAKKRDA